MKLITMKISNDLENFSFESLSPDFKSFKYSKKTIFNIRLMLEELLTNISRHSGNTEDIELKIMLYRDEIKLQVRDHGISFNPLELPEAKTTGSAIERKIGGLGVYIVRKLSDFISYDRIDNENILTVVTHAV